MPQYVEVNGQVVEFPDGMSVSAMESAVKANLLSIPSANKADSSSVIDTLKGGMKTAFPILSAVAQNPAQAMDALRNIFAGGVRGAGSIGATVARPFETGPDNQQRRERLDSNMRDLLGADTKSPAYSVGKLVGELAGTAGAGGAVAKALGTVPGLAGVASPLLDSIASAGFTAGGVGGGSGVALRAIGGGLSGGITAGMTNPEDWKVGMGIGALAPGAVQLAGAAGSAIKNAGKGAKEANAVKIVAAAIGVPEAQLLQVLQSTGGVKNYVPGSDLTLSQALQKIGKNSPEYAILERIAAGGPGGDALLKRYANQAAARMEALKAQGAQTYQGAAKEEATMAGDKIGAVLRTQANDDKAAARALWESVYGRAADDGVSLQLPLEDMQKAMGPLGRGSVVPGRDANNVLQVAQEIGTDVLPAIKPLKAGPVRNSQTLEQAVRAAGGLRGSSGELRDLGIRQSGTTGLINNKSGQAEDMLAEEMYRRGFIPDADPRTLLDALRNGGGRKLYANDQVESNALQRMAEAAMGDAPGAERIPKAVPFAEFQRLRRDSGSLAAKAGERAGSETEAGVLAKFQELLTRRADDAANGLPMAGDSVTPEFLAQYNAARGASRANAEKYKGGNNIASILRKPVGQDYTLTGDEIINKLWHGGAGLAGDVSNLKGVLSQNNYNPSMDALQRFIMTDAASRTTASGLLGSALPKYVENRMPGLLEAMTPEQLGALQSVAADIRNAEAAAALPGLRGSDTQAKISRAMDAGLLDSPIAKGAARLLSVKGVGGEGLRSKLAEAVIANKGKIVSELLANPAAAARALEDKSFMQLIDSGTAGQLRRVALKAAPLVGTN